MKNRYSVDTSYFRKLLKRALTNLADYKPDELARELARMSKTADAKVLLEPEFSDEGVRVAYELLGEIGKKAGVQSGDVSGLLEWIDKLPEPGEIKPLPLNKSLLKEQITCALEGIDSDAYDSGWWETSKGVEFGKRRFDLVMSIIDNLPGTD